MELPAESRLFHAGRLLWPGLPLPRGYVSMALDDTRARLAASNDSESSHFYFADWWLAKACLWDDPAGRTVRERAWGQLMRATAAREGRLLTERLMARACRAFPADQGARQEALDDFWGQLMAGTEGPGRLNAYRATRPLVPWLVAIFRNLCFDRLRQGSRAPTWLDHEDDWADTHSGSATDVMQDADAEAHVTPWFASLTNRQRTLAELRFRHGLNQKSAAAALGTTESTISRELTRVQDGFAALVNTVDDRAEAPREQIVTALLAALQRLLADPASNLSNEEMVRT